jgi:hypothetical protein
MGSSPGFGSTPCDSDALFGLAFATAPPVTGLTSPQRVTRRLILQKARRQAFRRPPQGPTGIALRLVVGARFQVLFHSPNRGTFHLSLTVLVHYRSPRVFSLGKWASLLPTGLACPVVLKVSDGSLATFAYGAFTLCGGPFQYPSASGQICHSLGPPTRPLSRLTTPAVQRCRPFPHDGFGLFPFRSPLLRE